MRAEDIPAAIYKWGGPWPHEIAETEMEFDPESGCVLLMYRPTAEAQAEWNKPVPGVDYKFVNELGEEIDRETWEKLDAQARLSGTSGGGEANLSSMSDPIPLGNDPVP